MAKNLNFEAENSKCYNDNSVNCTLYGRLYNWETIMNGEASSDKAPSGVQGICPAGFHVPSDWEWGVLDNKPYQDFLINNDLSSYGDLKATYGWNENGTDSYGFSALPGGVGYSNGSFGRLGSMSSWWSATNNGTNALAYGISQGNAISTGTIVLRSLRCLKNYDAPSSSSSYNPVPCTSVPDGHFCDDRDGKVYKTTTIDNQTWMAENLNFKIEGCSEEFSLYTAGLWCFCPGNNCTLYGRVYNWAAAMAIDPICANNYCVSPITEKHQGICPKGWHMPNRTEVDKLIENVGGSATAGQMLKAKSGWSNSNGMDAFGFAALPAGSAFVATSGVGSDAAWWYVNYGSNSHPYWLINGNSVSFTDGGSHSIRCIKD